MGIPVDNVSRRIESVYANRTIFLFTLAVFWAGVGATRAQASIYNQPTNYFGGYYSEDDTSVGGAGNYVTTYDDFALASTATIGSVSWVGSTVKGVTPTAFTIDIFANSTVGCPGAEPTCPNTGSLLYTTAVSGNAGQTFLLNDSFNNPTYSYTDPINFTAAGSTEYWISIVASVPSFEDWVWESGTGGDGYSFETYNGGPSELFVDEAFSLNSAAPVPEPMYAGLIGAGLVLLVLASRRFKRPIA
jgi:hypothetical protein